MMRVLILGGGGMLGHKLAQLYRNRFETWVTVRGRKRDYEPYGIFDLDHMIEGINIVHFDKIISVMGDVKPDVVINGVGIIKQLEMARDALMSLKINSMFPHRLGQLCRATGARLIHIGTDCVFNGHKGMYTEEDTSNAEDLYGRTKFLGEVVDDGCLTLRTSIIGRELRTSVGLIEWFLSNRGGRIVGFRKAIYTGFTTQAFANIIALVIVKHPDLSGLYQVSSAPITKYELLHLINDAYNAGVEIEPDDSFCCDRSLDSTRFRRTVGFEPVSWKSMIDEMADDRTPYDDWR